jgi:hypothetical protein
MNGGKGVCSSYIEMKGLDADHIDSLRELTGLPLDSLEHGMLADLCEHPVRITIYGDDAVAQFTVIRTVDRSVVHDFLEGLAK